MTNATRKNRRNRRGGIAPDEETRAIARRVIWFEEPEQALADRDRFLCYLMTHGRPEDVSAIARRVGWRAFGEALDHAPPGIMNRRSWAYWTLVLERSGAPFPARRAIPGAHHDDEG